MAEEPRNLGQRIGEGLQGLFSNPFLVGILSQIFPPFRDFMASAPGQVIIQGVAGDKFDAAQDEALDVIRGANEQGAALVNDFLMPMIERSQEIGEEAIGLGEEFFDPGEASARFGEAFGPVTEGLEALPGQIRTDNERVQQLYASLAKALQAGTADITGGFEDILGTATELVSGLGEAERQDINRRFTEAGTESQMALAARGLGGFGASITSGIERERSTALLGLEEQISQQQLGVQETFGLAGLSARERLLGAGINLFGQKAGAMQFGNQLFANTAMGSLAARGNIAGGQVGAFDQAATNRINSLLSAGGFSASAQLGATGQAFDFFGPLTVPFPSPPQFPNIFGSSG
ncbi:hypothetical protein LCGC14_0589800 [marine sediment metagenome]|uniref:Uncharacterized protein n=2 Tax=root TaxID=1 RepID=A0A9C9NEU4_9HYPH|nr:hypothetical protein [Aurantimonas coralicida]